MPPYFCTLGLGADLHRLHRSTSPRHRQTTFFLRNAESLGRRNVWRTFVWQRISTGPQTLQLATLRRCLGKTILKTASSRHHRQRSLRMSTTRHTAAAAEAAAGICTKLRWMLFQRRTCSTRGIQPMRCTRSCLLSSCWVNSIAIPMPTVGLCSQIARRAMDLGWRCSLDRARHHCTTALPMPLPAV